MKKGFWFNLFLLCVGVVAGTLVSGFCAGNPALSFLSYGLDFGMKAPATFDLQVLTVTFGISLNLNISVILCIILSIIIGNWIVKK